MKKSKKELAENRKLTYDQSVIEQKAYNAWTRAAIKDSRIPYASTSVDVAGNRAYLHNRFGLLGIYDWVNCRFLDITVRRYLKFVRDTRDPFKLDDEDKDRLKELRKWGK